MPGDVVVIGAGPAGLYAAQHLASRGLAVRLLEEHDRIGEPVHCTGLLGTEAFALPGIPRDAVVGSPTTVRFHSPAGYCVDYAAPEGEACIIDRLAFDRSLAEAAVRAGAQVINRARAVGVQVGRAGVVIHARIAGRPQTLSALTCILACGASYRFQRDLGWGIPPLLFSSAQAEVKGVATERLDVFFRPDMAPTGFGWLVPVTRGGQFGAKVGVMAPARARRVLDRLLHELAEAGRISGSPGPVVVRPLPLAPLARTYGNRVLAIGDAAGLVKPTTGGGIYYSLLSARWASETLVEAFERGDFSASMLGGYEETWRCHLRLELSVGVWFRRLAAWLTPADLDALTRLGMTDGVMPLIRATARFNWHRDLILETLRHPAVLQIVLRRLLAVAQA